MTRWVVCFLLLCPGFGFASDVADTIIQGGAIYTVDASRSWAEALAIKDGKIVFVGADKDIDRYIGTHTRVIALNGEMVLPGFHDSHIHPISAMLKNQMCTLRGLADRAAYLVKIRECLKNDSTTDWLMGSGWSHAYFDEEHRPDKQLLDSISRNTPITLVSYDGHSVWANSKALELSEIDENTSNPPSGIIERYEGTQEPSGLFFEDPAIRMVFKARPAFTDDQRYAALLEVQSYLNSLGITSIQDAWVEQENLGLNGSIPAYQRAASAEQLTLRVIAALYWQPDAGMEQLKRMKLLRTESHIGLFNAGSVKIWQDGVMHTHTSRLLDDYADQPGQRGLSMFEQNRLNQIVATLDKQQFQIHIHADGDGAVRQALDALEFAIQQNGKRDSRHMIAHLELVHPDDVRRFRQLGVTASVQPMWSTSRRYISDLLDVKLGVKRKANLEINRSFFKAGVNVAYGSDWFVTSPNPMDLIEAAVTRIRPALSLQEKRNSTALLPGEEVTVGDAIASLTINGAYAFHQDDVTGSLETGKLADIVVLDKNLFETEPVRISETRVLFTLLAGKTVYNHLDKEN